MQGNDILLIQFGNISCSSRKFHKGNSWQPAVTCQGFYPGKWLETGSYADLAATPSTIIWPQTDHPNPWLVLRQAPTINHHGPHTIYRTIKRVANWWHVWYIIWYVKTPQVMANGIRCKYAASNMENLQCPLRNNSGKSWLGKNWLTNNEASTKNAKLSKSAGF